MRSRSGECENCGVGFPQTRSDRRFCSAFCGEVTAGKRFIGPQGAVIVCVVCRQRKAVQRPDAHVCDGPECRRVRDRERMARIKLRSPERYRNIARSREHRRRAQRRGRATVVENISVLDVFTRDGWRCQLCADKVLRGARYPHPLSASLDHIVPLSLGGDHSLANVQCAHLSCNLEKGIRARDEQLRLIG